MCGAREPKWQRAWDTSDELLRVPIREKKRCVPGVAERLTGALPAATNTYCGHASQDLPHRGLRHQGEASQTRGNPTTP